MIHSPTFVLSLTERRYESDAVGASSHLLLTFPVWLPCNKHQNGRTIVYVCHYWIWRETSLPVRAWGEVSGLLITDVLAKEAAPLPSLAAVQILTFFYPCAPMGDKLKNRGMDRRHPAPWGRGVYVIFLCEREKWAKDYKLEKRQR